VTSSLTSSGRSFYLTFTQPQSIVGVPIRTWKTRTGLISSITFIHVSLGGNCSMGCRRNSGPSHHRVDFSSRVDLVCWIYSARNDAPLFWFREGLSPTHTVTQEHLIILCCGGTNPIPRDTTTFQEWPWTFDLLCPTDSNTPPTAQASLVACSSAYTSRFGTGSVCFGANLVTTCTCRTTTLPSTPGLFVFTTYQLIKQ
jgi:hypothetical protein